MIQKPIRIAGAFPKLKAIEAVKQHQSAGGFPRPRWYMATLSQKTSACHFRMMLYAANQLHSLAVVKDAEACERFYGELQKKPHGLYEASVGSAPVLSSPLSPAIVLMPSDAFPDSHA